MQTATLVTGGTGTLGRLVVPRLREAGCKVRVLSRRSREAGEGIEFVTGDLATGEGIGAAVEGAAERVVADSGLPWTTLRATQFHDLFLMTARKLARLPVIGVPPVGRRTWEGFLADRVSSSSDSRASLL